MADDREYNRNPFVIPDEKPVDRACCKLCGSKNFDGQRIGSTVEFTCQDCGNKWTGGIAQERAIPARRLPVNPRSRQPIEFTKNPKTGELEEILNPPDLTQDFRKGALIPGDDDPYGW